MRRLLLLASLLCLALPGIAAASTWTEIPSGTSDAINTVEYRADGRFWFATATGDIYTKVGDTFQRTYNGSASISDIDFRPAGDIGVAVGANGTVLRSTDYGATWGSVGPLQTSKWNGSSPCATAVPLESVHFVRFVGDNRVLIGSNEAQLMRSDTTGATWADANRHVGGCRIDAGEPLVDVAPTGDPNAYFVIDGSDRAHLTTNNLASDAVVKSGEVANGMEPGGGVAIDPGNPDRLWGACGGCPYGNSGAQYTETGYNDSHWINIANPSARAFPSTGPNDVDFAGGTAVFVGVGGLILTSNNGRDFFHVAATGGIATNDWRAVSLADGSRGAIAGLGGKLAISTDAGVTPDIEPPTLTVSGPASVPAGAPATFTATAADTGGSGVDPNGFTWTATGLPNVVGGSSQSLTFPSPGNYQVRVTARDLAGNVSTQATTSVTVTQAVPLTVTFPTDAASRPTITLVGGKVNLRVKGRVAAPAGRSCAGKMRITVKRKKKRIARKTVTVKPDCSYAKRIKIKRRKVRRAKKLKVILQFLPAAGTGLSRSKIVYTTRIK